MVEEILKQKEVNAYVVDEETHELTYISPQLAEEFPHVKMQEVCYRALKGLDAICENCPLHLLEKNRSSTAHQFDELSHRWMRLSANRINWKDSPHNHALICNYDITSTIENVTLIDPLTGIANLTKFMIEGGKRLKATPNRSYAVVYADINDFRYINQVHGYEIGNAILREVAAILEDGMRRDELCAHINGDRFVLLLKYVNQTNLKKRLFQLSEQFTEIKNRFVGTVNITASSGVYVIPEDQNDITKAINNAELAHKKAKASKHTPIVFHEESLMKELALVKAIENKMQHALDHDEFLLYMQPKYDTHTNTISGLESLTRWKYDENRILGPGDFIPIFEKNGFINRMTHHMAEKVFQTIRGWIDNRLIVVPIAINISYNYLISDYFCNDFIDLLKRYKIPPQLIEIELTETICKEDVGIILEQMIRMKNLGFKIAIDDFGSGYSSLILLRDLPVDILKLDKGFFKNDVVGKKEMVIIENIVHMAQELGIDIVSEGVESEEQLKFLSKIGCHYVQGYYFARPMDVDQAIELLNQKKGEI